MTESQPLIDVTPEQWRIVSNILKAHVPHHEVWAFGSRAKWTAKPYSDLDLALISSDPLPIAVEAALADAFSESDLPWKVDLVDWAVSSPEFQSIIQRDKVVLQKSTNEGLLADWCVTTVENIKANRDGAITIGPFGSRMKSDCYVVSGVPVVRGTNLGEGKGLEGDFVYITPEKALEFPNCRVEEGDLVFPHRGAIGRVGYIKSNEPMIISSSMMKLSCDKLKFDPLFYYYFFRTQNGVHQLLKNASTVGTPGIGQPLTSLRGIQVPVPPLPEQRAIAHILGTLDDKIELNRKTNETLEAMAKALFKSWFVDFDPVRAKAAGRHTGLPDEISDLFPDSFEESEQGEIPAGWRVMLLKDACRRIFSGGTPDTRNPKYWGGGLPWFSSGETRNAYVIGTEKTITELGARESSTRIAQPGTTVIASAGQGHTRGQTSILLIEAYINQSVVALEANEGLISQYRLFLDLSNRYDEFRRVSDSASSRGSLTCKILGGLPAMVPGVSVDKSFADLISPIVGKIGVNLRRAKILENIRDALLPKLISGELRVPNAATFLEEAGV